MTPTLYTCTWLLLPFCVFVSLSTGELDFYRDEVPESPENIALMEYRARQLVKLLETQNHQQYPQRGFFSSLLANRAHKKHYRGIDHDKDRDLLETLTDRAKLAEILRKEKTRGWNHRQTQYNEPVDELPREREHYLSFYELNPFENPLVYPNFRLPYFPSKINNQEANYQEDAYEYNQNGPLKQPYEEREFDQGMKEEPLLQFHETYDGPVDEKVLSNERNVQKQHAAIPDFTYRFDDSNLKDRHPFAVKPNDPRYYENAPFFQGDDDTPNTEKTIENKTKWEQKDTAMEKMQAMDEENLRNTESKFKDSSMIMLSELERNTGYNPLVVPVNHDLNNDIYFIAIVAGCSAAAMFALVLIALTWCRLKRGAKAAADIEYPAYGVTGPNKEISPSGDQRLAQSAQMYHFQHQKQQIIAMEKDPGSISEAESEEENEEGDYTVYECPGLASTGEMEVKNPLFHDDPTPATPAQINKEEDHI